MIKKAKDEHGVRGNTTITDYLAEMVDNGELSLTYGDRGAKRYNIASANDQKEQVKEKESSALDFDEDGWDDIAI